MRAAQNLASAHEARMLGEEEEAPPDPGLLPFSVLCRWKLSTAMRSVFRRTSVCPSSTAVWHGGWKAWGRTVADGRIVQFAPATVERHLFREAKSGRAGVAVPVTAV